MRTAALLALVVAALACGAEPPPSCGAPGLVRACACVGGAAGAQECSPGGAWAVCACPDGGTAEAGTDAGGDAATDAPPLDALSDVAADGGAEAGGDGPGDAAEDARPPTEDRLADGGCPEGFAMCVGTTCNNILTSRMWCGDCRALCGARSECVGGRCVTRASGVSCGPGQGDCDGDPANGCEAMTWSDRANCGGCGRACAENELRCLDGACLPR